MRKLLIISIIIFLVLFSFAAIRRMRKGLETNGTPPVAGTYSSGNYNESITVDGRERTYLLHVPVGLEAKKQYPLMVLLHGGGGDAELAAKMSGMSKKADAEKFIALYPEGVAGATKLRSWNAGDCCAYASRQKIDDVGFIKTLVEKIKKDYPVDSRRVYVSGMSNGAMMTHRVACELSDIFAGAAAVAGTIQVSSCSPSNPIAFIAFHGTADDNVPYSGGPGTGNFTTKNVFVSAEKTASDWAERNQCPTGPKTETISPLANDGVTIEKISYGSCKNSADTILYRLNGGKHYWPGGEPGLRQEAAIPTKAISATDVIWEFFKGHAKQ